MKKFLYLLIILCFLSLKLTAAENNSSDKIESYISSGSSTVICINNASAVIKFFSFIEKNLLGDNPNNGLRKQVFEIKSYSGVDLLDINSLENFGINTKSRIYMAYTQKRMYGNDINIFVPVHDPDKFPMKFTEFMKKNPRVNPDKYNPVITEQNGYKIYQLSRDMFLTTIDNYFVICSSENGIKSVIEKKDSMISDDESYKKLKIVSEKNNDEIMIFNSDFNYKKYINSKATTESQTKYDPTKVMHGLSINDNDFIYHSYFVPENSRHYKGTESIADVNEKPEIAILKESTAYGFTKLNLKNIYKVSEENPESVAAQTLKDMTTGNKILDKLILDKFHNTMSVSGIGKFYYVVFLVDDIDLNNKVRKEISNKLAEKYKSEVNEIKNGKLTASVVTDSKGKSTYIITAKQYLIMSNTLDNVDKFLTKKNLLSYDEFEKNFNFKIENNYNNVYKIEDFSMLFSQLMETNSNSIPQSAFMMYLSKIKEVILFTKLESHIMMTTVIINNR